MGTRRGEGGTRLWLAAMLTARAAACPATVAYDLLTRPASDPSARVSASSAPASVEAASETPPVDDVDRAR